MPNAAPRPCRSRGCKAVTTAKHGYCAEHAGEYDRQRGSATARDYGAHWRQLRAAQPKTPCVVPECQAPWLPSHHLDHKIPRPIGTDDPTNLQWLCKRCHSSKTAKHDGGFGRIRKP